MTADISKTADKIESVHALLHPSSVAIIGARERPGGWADRIRWNLKRFGFPGTVYAVNPRHERLWDEPCYPNLSALPTPADHLVVLVPAAAAVDSLSDAHAFGVRSSTVFATGSEHVDLGAELAAITARTGLAISGPNCLGNLSVPGRLVTTTEARIEELVDGPVAVVGQSGGIVHSLHRVLASRGIGVRYAVSSGDEACLSTADYLRYFAEEPDIRIVLAFVESVRDWPSFVDACALLRRHGKHVVAIKVGHSDASRTAAASHTGALAGSYAAFEAAAGVAGVITAPSMDVAVEACEYLSRQGAPAGPGVGMITLSGGVRELLLDAASRQEVDVTTLAPSTLSRLNELVGDDVEASNPLDSGYAGVSNPGTLIDCVTAMAADDNVDVMLVQEELLTHHLQAKEATLARFDAAFSGIARETKVPVALFSMCSNSVTAYGRELRSRFDHLVFLQSTDKALAAVTAIARANHSALHRDAALTERTDTAAARDAAQAILAQRRSGLTEIDAKQMFAGYGFQAPREVFAGSPEAAAELASSLRAPFVAKVVSPALIHKSDAGGVALGLEGVDDVFAACSAFKDRHPDAGGFLVVEQVSPARVEFVIGFVRDPEVGPVVMVGSGGTGVEVFGDVAFAPVPCSRREAANAIGRTRAGRTLLGPWRGHEACDFEAMVSAVCAMSWFAQDLSDVVESAEINPLVAIPGEPGVLVLDALVVPSATDKADTDRAH